MSEISFMDLLDLDEEMIDLRLKTIMGRKSYTTKHLTSAILLLQYKQLINCQEGTECENDEECNFIAKLVNDVHIGNVDNVCKITNIVLCLNPSTIISKSEHIIQQIVSNIYLPSEGLSDGEDDVKSSKTLLSLKLCDSILDALIQFGEKISLLFLETPLENVLSSCDEKLKIHFLTNTVPKLFEAVVGYNILDRIWILLKQLKDENKENGLKTLSCLSEFFLPVPDSKGNVKFESQIIFQYDFWSLILFGLMSNDPSVRKVSVYLMKRAIDCIRALQRDFHVSSELDVIFSWEHKLEKRLKQTWDNYFILIDSLEEKQSNIVLPSLQLFETLNVIQNCWLNCAFNIGLKHDNIQVRSKCIEYRLQSEVNNDSEAVTLLEALNDINLYDNANEYEILMRRLSKAIENIHSFIHIFKAISQVKWSPLPLYHFSNVLADMSFESILSAMEHEQICKIIIEVLKVPCNNIAIRKAVHVNISSFVGKCCKGLYWKELVNIYSAFKVDRLNTSLNPIVSLFEYLYLKEDEKIQYFKFLCDSYQNIDILMLHLNNHDDVKILLNILAEKVRKVQDIVNRQYCDKMECFNDIVFLLYLFNKTVKSGHTLVETINIVIAREYKIISQYMNCLLSNDTELSIEEVNTLFKGFNSFSTVNDCEVKETILQLYKSAFLLLEDKNTEINKKILSVHVFTNLVNNSVLTTHYKHEMVRLEFFLEVIKKTEFKEVNMESCGRIRNVFYETSCEIVYYLLKEQKDMQKNIKEIIDFIENIVECGGYGCLKWILRIMNYVLPELLNYRKIDFNIAQFINRMWKEIEELKSNNQYSPCIEEFVNLITQEALLNKSMYNNIVVLFCNKIIEYGPVKNTPLYYLVKKLNRMNITADYGQIVYALCEILLYAPVPRKDQRITDNVVVEILYNPKYGLTMSEIDMHFNFEIQYLAISTLCNINDPEIFEIITSFIINKIDDNFKNKHRYHGNSQPHRLLLIGLQHLLFVSLLNVKTLDEDWIASWSMELLGKLPHQPSVRICLEWYIALHFHVKKVSLNDDLLQLLKSKNIPVTSQFIILYWTVKHRISNGTSKKEEYEFVINTLLSYTMGQMFNIRLHAQYLATKIYADNITKPNKYAYIIEVIEKTFTESAKDKNFVKLKDDLFVNDFDIVSHLTPCFIYYFLPKYCAVGINEKEHDAYIRDILKVTNESLNRNDPDIEFKKEWTLFRKSDDEIFNYNLSKNLESDKPLDNGDMMGTIQKKYIPWKNMSDIDVYENGKKKESSSELIVVASLIDKLPNLGGMARTSEVFGVKTYVVDSLRHLQDKQFQGLSVSAERWVNIEEIRPGPPLKNYLMSKKAEGYSVVAAEQTSTSCQLQTFKFPKKTLLLLGHEKEGIPCDLLPIMDYCVEVPQQGYVRSLNVHVTAAIFVWEYTRRNIL